MPENDTIITTTEMRELGLCCSGVKHGITKHLGPEMWKKFIKEGLSVEELGVLVNHPDVRKAITLARNGGSSNG